ncbi:hypothetical protein DASC09_060210 [Saccharomycopsis crataegensis]|uniref:Peroxisomal membrane protein PEX16 n=1 Tax=Saccharomycopsis crataegensis TaxID=43959 RepID=A0AAV5QUT9_9ASCO|nr:hypothetical protein DASC09_060210 [Saccharomycopsis crataegensis]
MDDEKVEHLRKLAERAAMKRSRVKNGVSNNVNNNNVTTPINTTNNPLESPETGLFSIMKKHSGIPFIFAIIRRSQSIPWTYESYEMAEENIINLLEVFSFTMNYFVSTRSRAWRRFLKIVDKVILALRLKILVFKVVKLYKLQSFINNARKHREQPDNTSSFETAPITITASDNAETTKIVVLEDNNNNNNNNNNNSLTTSSTQVIELKGSDAQVESFEQAWKESNSNTADTKREIDSDVVELAKFKSTEDQIHGLRTEIFVELLDFLLLLYPKSITQLVYEKIFSRKKD